MDRLLIGRRSVQKKADTPSIGAVFLYVSVPYPTAYLAQGNTRGEDMDPQKSGHRPLFV